MTNGVVVNASRVEGDSRFWRIAVIPDSNDDVVIVLAAERACNIQGAICGKGRKRLSNSLLLTVQGPEEGQ